MNQIVFGRWTLDTDPELTRAAFSKIAHGSPELCGCDPCLNFAASRETTYPPEFRRLLVELGVSYDREAEIYHNGNLKNGLHSYGGWFHFVGTIVSGGDAVVQITDHFLVYVSVYTGLVNQAFDSMPLVQIEFSAEIPWAIATPEPD